MASVTGTNGAGSGLSGEYQGFGVMGDSDTGEGVVALSDTGYALIARSKAGPSGLFQSDNGDGLASLVNAPFSAAVAGIANSQQGTGVYGDAETGVYGSSDSGVGVWGDTSGGSGSEPTLNCGVHGRCLADWGTAVFGEVTGAGYAIYGWTNFNANSWAGVFEGQVFLGGNVNITGSLSKPGGSFKIDHPLDPSNKYLSHSFVESPDMLNIYNGLVQLDEHGAAIVELPEWFDVLNHEFRYQLTPIGSPAPNLHVASEIERRSFRIAGGTPEDKVSWQVTGIRQDKWANANRIQVEEEKPTEERGRYLHPELFGETEDKKIMPGPRPRIRRQRPVRPRRRARS